MNTTLLITLLLVNVLWIYCNGSIVNPYNLLIGGGSPGPPKQQNNNDNLFNVCDLKLNEDNIITPDEDHFNITIAHKLFKSDVLVAGLKYQVHIKRIILGPSAIEITIKSSVGDVHGGEFIGTDNNNCEANIFKTQFTETSGSEIMVNWTFHNNKDVIKLNISFELYYTIDNSPAVYRIVHSIPAAKDCQLHLNKNEAVLTYKEIPYTSDCLVWFPKHESGHGLVIELVRLNVPCSKGYLHFTSPNTTEQPQHFRNHKPTHLCGKLEEFSETDRHIYFPSSHLQPYMHLHGNPVFSITYHLVDYCYNVTFLTRNGSFELKPSGDLQCTFKIYLPYGNRVALTLQIGDSTSTGTPETGLSLQDVKNGESVCYGLLTELYDGGYTWSHCTKPGDAERQIEIVSRENKVVLKVSVRNGGGGEGGGASALGLRMMYRAEPVESVVGVCGFGWIALRQFCVTAVEGTKLPWNQAESECVRKGGHLASIRSEHDQMSIDNLLFNSPGYRDHNAYWIGASDKTHEGDFRWSDGLLFSYTNWFPGWAQHGHYNKQPNDDGLSKQDCVEVRRIYSLPTSSASLASTFMWNDRDCSTPNYFICERLQNDEPLENNEPPDCNRSIILSRQQPRASVSSPYFPRQYPDNAACDTLITVPSGYRLVLDFEELVLENEPTCSYDYLEISELVNTSLLNSNSTSRRLCGDWSSKLKLLRYVSNGSKMKLTFVSDYSHHFSGYKARVSMENAMQCSDDRLQMFNNSCYLIVSYPEVTWSTAQHICRGIKANLASVLSPEEERFITTTIRKTTEYRTRALYWLGAKVDMLEDNFQWIDGNPMDYLGWFPGHKPNHDDLVRKSLELNCLSVQWMPSPKPLLSSGLYWKEQRCNNTGGYVCKRRFQLLGTEMNFNKTLNGTDGNLTTPNYPGTYYNNLDFSVRIVGPERTRLQIEFRKLDIEFQLDCLYDYVELRTVYKGGKRPRKYGGGTTVKWCGTHDNDMHRFDFVSETNEAELTFHSDYSISGIGFHLIWRAIDVSACPMQTLTAKEGLITSPNYPFSLLSHLDCTITILAPSGQRVWLEFYATDMQMNENDDQVDFQIGLGKQSDMFRPFETDALITEGSFLSKEARLKIRLRTGDNPRGFGFQAKYKTLNVMHQERIIHLNNYTSGILLHLNYPDLPPPNVDFLQHFVAPLGYIILLELYYVRPDGDECTDGYGVIEVYDNYSGENGTSWKMCYDPEAEDSVLPAAPISITSYLNTLHLRQKGTFIGIPLNGSLRVQSDPGYKNKLFGLKEEQLESCSPNPCLNGGKCVAKNSHKFCKCVGHFTGMFCALDQCELEPCVFGTCELTNTSFKCHCKTGYVGSICDQKRKPCEGNPCESRGTCIERGDSYQCRCHAWWEGSRCEKRMMHIPYKPLSERMLHEPFWLGLMTVFVVMAVIGLVWCAKRHFPEKIEKLLAEESERNRMSSLRSASVREQLAAASNAAAAVQPSPAAPGASRSLFGRLGIRKPSILSLTSPHASGYVPATARTFSLDDLLKPPPRRTPSPKKKRNNSTPTKKNVAEKKQILQQLISPNSKQNTRKVSLGELIQMSERKITDNGEKKSDNWGITTNETKFSDSDAAQAALNDPKLEKKVTFARLINKVSAEMSSGSEMELGIMQANRLGCMFARPSSTPPSPGIDARSPNSTSSNQGSDSFTSSDLAIPCALSSSISDFLDGNKRRLPNGRQKPASADSILAMFRNFSSSSAAINLPSSLRVSPSTTPTASSPQDDIVGDDESSTSSIYTPISFSSGPPESPILHRNTANTQSTIEVPVLDPLSAHKSSTSNFLHPPTILLEIPSTINKCLSPIRELPTPLPSPMPSPALTPIMRRSAPVTNVNNLDDIDSEDRLSVELPNISISCSEPEDEHRNADIAIDLQAEDGLILEEAAAMQHSALYKIKNRPSPLGQLSDENHPPPPLIIPTLTIQTPSPTHARPPLLLHPGSPPPHRSCDHETSFQFPAAKPNRKLYKDFEKPTSLDLPCAPPMITITCNLSEAESDAESISPAAKSSGHHHGASASGMTYLSPFSMSARGDHTASESNLSSSGYSSMASPGPSRCGSSNPLCPSEMEDQGPPGSGQTPRRQSITPVLKTSSNPTECANKTNEEQRRGRSDSETLSDDPQMESNDDEGIGTDHIDEKIDEGEVKSAKELEVFMVNDETSLDKKSASLENTMERLLPPTNKNSLQLPSIVIQCESLSCEKHLSPMSSRSESPLSDKTTGFGRFSPQFYGQHKDLLPFTDSDGLYDFPSTDKMNITTNVQHKKTGRKREKKQVLRNCKTPSPTKTPNKSITQQLHHHLDVPSSKDGFHKCPPPRKLSPKRRIARSQVVSSSSSSESIQSAREFRLSSSSPSPETIRWSSPVSWIDEKCHKSLEGPIEDDMNSSMVPISSEHKHQKVSRLRAISHQIRFLRRLELSLKRRERTISPSDSLDSEEESRQVTVPLLQPSTKIEIRKSSSISKLQNTPSSSLCKNRRGKLKRGELLLGEDESSWKKVVITGSGHSD